MRAAAMAGIFDPQGKSRGTGAHLTENGELVIHCGDKIYVTGEHAGYQDPGLIDGYVYPAGPSRPRPDPLEQSSAAGEILLAHLKAWSWFREVEDPMLALGWIGCALVGGALDWRPHAWITGGSGTGKSTLAKASPRFVRERRAHNRRRDAGGRAPVAPATDAPGVLG
jgi:hypothetical protein